MDWGCISHSFITLSFTVWHTRGYWSDVPAGYKVVGNIGWRVVLDVFPNIFFDTNRQENRYFYWPSSSLFR